MRPIERPASTLATTALPSLTLIVPDLLWSGPGSGLPHPAGDQPLPALTALLSRAEVREDAWDDSGRTLSHLFDLALPPGDPLPAGALTLPPGQARDAYWLCADPIHLRPDRNRLVAFDRRAFHLDAEEAQRLTAEIEAHFADLGWRLRATTPYRWQLRLSSPADIRTTPFDRIVGRDIHPLLPTGGGAREWHGLINEVQMLLYQSPINQAREVRGEATANSLWFWGEGRLPPRPPRRFVAVWADQPTTVGLARHAESPVHATPRTADAWLDRAGRIPGAHLVLLDALGGHLLLGDLESWIAGLRTLERDWFGPLWTALRQGRIGTLDLHPVDGRRFHLRPTRFRGWWRRTRPYARHLRAPWNG